MSKDQTGKNMDQSSKGRTASEWYTAEDLIANLRRAERDLKTDFEQQFPDGSEKTGLQNSWQPTMILLEGALVNYSLEIAEEIYEPPDQLVTDQRPLLIRNMHVRMKELAWAALVDVGGLLLGILALGGGELAGGVTGSALSVSDLIRNSYKNITELDSDQVMLYRATAKLERQRRLQNHSSQFPTEAEVIEEVMSQLKKDDESLHASLWSSLSLMLGDSLISKGGGQIAIY